MTTREFVIRTLLSESTDIFKLRLSKWLSHHFDMYRRLIGNRQRIGIEIEYNSYLISDFQKHRIKIINSTKWVGTDNFNNGFELTRLYDVSTPEFIIEVFSSLEELKTIHFGTLGGLHINVQSKNTDNNWELLRGNSKKLRGVFESGNYCRIENKKGMGFINPQCLIAQFILTSYECKLSKNYSTNGRKSLLANIYTLYPKVLAASAVNLDKALV